MDWAKTYPKTETTNMFNKQSYRGCTITNIRHEIKRGEGAVYADLVDKDGALVVSARLSYVSKVVEARLTKEVEEDDGTVKITM